MLLVCDGDCLLLCGGAGVLVASSGADCVVGSAG